MTISNKERIGNGLLVPLTVTFNAESLRAGLAAIAERPLFCTWKLEPNPDKPDKPRKVPYVRGGAKLTGGYDDPKLAEKLMTLEAAIAEYARLGHAGIGLVFSPGCGVVGLDLDHCIDPEIGWTLKPEQKISLGHFKKHGFIEVSQSGTGLHVIALGDAVTQKANGSVEVFGNMNFLALTGAHGSGIARQMPSESIAEVAAVIDQIKDNKRQKPANYVSGVSLPALRTLTRTAAINSDVLTRHAERPDPERAKSALLAIESPKERDAWLRLVWAHQAAGGTIEDMITHSHPGSEVDLERIRRSFNPDRPGGVGPGTLYKIANEAGWKGQMHATTSIDSSDPESVEKSVAAQPTDLWLSNRFAKENAAELRHDHSLRIWRSWRAGSWSLCRRGEQIEAMKQLAGALMEEAGKQQRLDPHNGLTKKLLACAQRAQNSYGIDAALKLAQSDPTVAVSSDEFDKDPVMFNVANGVVHLPSGELRDHDPSLMLFRQSPVNYDATATCPEFEKFMLEVSCNDPDWVDYMQRTFGYALGGAVCEEKLFFWLGTGANGKSVLANVLAFIQGSYAGIAPSTFLMLKRGDGGGATPDMANLAGARAVLANEVEAGASMSGQTVKVAVSTEAITARHLYGAPFTFKPTHKLFIRGNHRPRINDNDEGIWRRIHLIPFDLNLQTEQRDKTLEGRLLNEAPGILSWMVRGYQKWQQDGLRPARRVLDASLAYRRESDLLAQWVEDHCETGQDKSGMFSDLQQTAYQNYRCWCDQQGLRPFAKKSFTRGLIEQGFKEGRQGSGSRLTTYIGFRLNVS